MCLVRGKFTASQLNSFMLLSLNSLQGLIFLEVLECCNSSVSVVFCNRYAISFRSPSTSFVHIFFEFLIYWQKYSLKDYSLNCLFVSHFVHFHLLIHYFLILKRLTYRSYCVSVVGLWWQQRFNVNVSDPKQLKLHFSLSSK